MSSTMKQIPTKDLKGKGKAPQSLPSASKWMKPQGGNPLAKGISLPRREKSKAEYDLEGAFHEEFGEGDVEPPTDPAILNRPRVRLHDWRKAKEAGSKAKTSAAAQPAVAQPAAVQPAASGNAGSLAPMMAGPDPASNYTVVVGKPADILFTPGAVKGSVPKNGPAGKLGEASSSGAPKSGTSSLSAKELEVARILAILKDMVKPSAPPPAGAVTKAAVAAGPLPKPSPLPSKGADVAGQLSGPAAKQPAKPAPAVAKTAPKLSKGTEHPVSSLQDIKPQVPQQQPTFPAAVVPVDRDEGDLPDAPPCPVVHVAVDREIDMTDAPPDHYDQEDVVMSDAPVLRAYGGRSLPLSRKHAQFLRKMRVLQSRGRSERRRRMTINLWGTGLFPEFSRNFTDPQVKIDRGGVYLVGRSTCKWPRRG
ncbi:hypothetical protein TWF718_009170 [Orbilia javanica]|uniref:Uncharacterized protein n=1 Tax=Orbilia javanica TaxID=47235 RepID=A0AAN8N2E7_9PEZI